MAEDDGAHLVATALLDGALQRHGAALEGAFCHYDDARGLAALLRCRDEVGYLFRRHGVLGDEYGFGAACHADAERDVSCAPAHHLDEEQPAVASGCVAEAVDGLERDVDGGVEPDGHVSPVDVVVDGAGKPHYLDAVFLLECQCSAEAAVATDYHQSVDSVASQDFSCQRASRGMVELL